MHSCECCGRETRARGLCGRCIGSDSGRGDGRKQRDVTHLSLEDIEFAVANDDDGWPYSDRDEYA